MSCKASHDRSLGVRCAECLKDIQRFLRQDDSESRQAFFALGQFNLAKNMLMPLITTYPNDTDLVYNARESQCLARQ